MGILVCMNKNLLLGKGPQLIPLLYPIVPADRRIWTSLLVQPICSERQLCPAARVDGDGKTDSRSDRAFDYRVVRPAEYAQLRMDFSKILAKSGMSMFYWGWFFPSWTSLDASDWESWRLGRPMTVMARCYLLRDVLCEFRVAVASGDAALPDELAEGHATVDTK